MPGRAHNFYIQVEEQISRFLLQSFHLPMVPVNGKNLLLSVQGKADGMKKEIWAERKSCNKLCKGAISLQPWENGGYF